MYDKYEKHNYINVRALLMNKTVLCPLMGHFSSVLQLDCPHQKKETACSSVSTKLRTNRIKSHTFANIFSLARYNERTVRNLKILGKMLAFGAMPINCVPNPNCMGHSSTVCRIFELFV